jgi:quaternary ammonium compound-resistance protein SugE
MNSIFIGYLWCALAALASTGATYFIKLSTQVAESSLFWNWPRLFYLGTAVASYGIGFVWYSFALKRLPISLAYPVMTAVTLVMITGVGAVLLSEELNAMKLIGLVLVAVGAFFLTR